MEIKLDQLYRWVERNMAVRTMDLKSAGMYSIP
jgi:hypothetical protein